MTRNLADHQRWLASLILDPEPLERDAAAAVAPVAIDDVELARRRLGAYVGGYPARLHEALDEAYPAIHNIVGHDTFAALMRRYRATVPEFIYSLSDVGRELAAFLASDPLHDRLPFLADLAKLEWCVLRAFHAFEREPFDTTPLAAWSTQQWHAARFEFQPAVAIIESAWPICDLWNVRDTPRDQIDVEVVGRPQAVLVRRAGFDVHCEIVERLEAHLLVRLVAGAPLGEALDDLADGSSTTAEAGDTLDVGTWFARWAAAGMITRCTSES
jgi:hypothetical protein